MPSAAGQQASPRSSCFRACKLGPIASIDRKLVGSGQERKCRSLALTAARAPPLGSRCPARWLLAARCAAGQPEDRTRQRRATAPTGSCRQSAAAAAESRAHTCLPLPSTAGHGGPAAGGAGNGAPGGRAGGGACHRGARAGRSGRRPPRRAAGGGSPPHAVSPLWPGGRAVAAGWSLHGLLVRWCAAGGMGSLSRRLGHGGMWGCRRTAAAGDGQPLARQPLLLRPKTIGSKLPAAGRLQVWRCGASHGGAGPRDQVADRLPAAGRDPHASHSGPRCLGQRPASVRRWVAARARPERCWGGAELCTGSGAPAPVMMLWQIPLLHATVHAAALLPLVQAGWCWACRPAPSLWRSRRW